MIDGFLSFSEENNLIEEGDRILVGVSGGIDSVVLLDILNNLQGRLGIKIAVAHVNYSLRKESDTDNEFVKDLAQKYQVAFFEKKVKITGNNIEEKARNIRYGFFNDLCKQEDFNKIAVAHHKNDLVETFFLNLSRGSGLTGLVSMKPKNDILIRPLLFASRNEVEEYAKRHKLRNVEDVTNKDLSIKRNLIRHKIIPDLEESNPDLVETISSEIEDLSNAYALIMEMTANHYRKLASESSQSVSISVKSLKTINPYLQTELLRMAIYHVKGDLRDISRQNITDILKLIDTTNGTKETHLREGLIVRRTYDKLKVEKETKSPAIRSKGVRLEVNQEIVFANWRLFLSKKGKKPPANDKTLVFLDIQKTPTLHVRCKKLGDRIEIGEGKTKSLQDLFVDEKIPKNERGSYPIVVNDRDEIVWIPGLRRNPFYTSLDKENILVLKAMRKNLEKK